MIPLHYKFRQSTSDPGTWNDGQSTTDDMSFVREDSKTGYIYLSQEEQESYHKLIERHKKAITLLGGC